VPRDVSIEADIAQRVLTEMERLDPIATPTRFTCPECGGVLSELDEKPEARFRCYTGHAFTADALLRQQDARIEETLWVALRMFEERRNLIVRLAATGPAVFAQSSAERAADSQVHIDRLRQMLRSPTCDHGEFLAERVAPGVVCTEKGVGVAAL